MLVNLLDWVDMHIQWSPSVLNQRIGSLLIFSKDQRVLCKSMVKVFKQWKSTIKGTCRFLPILPLTYVFIKIQKQQICLGSSYVLDGRETIKGKADIGPTPQSSCKHAGKREMLPGKLNIERERREPRACNRLLTPSVGPKEASRDTQF